MSPHSRPHKSRVPEADQGSTIRVILVDDEKLMRRHLRDHLGEHADFEIVGEADSVTSAWNLIAEEHPEVVFLDVQMSPDEGFALLPMLEELEAPPSVVFVTAFDKFAIRAFEANALDYLTKPIHPERFLQTLERIRRERFHKRIIAASHSVEEAPIPNRNPYGNEGKPSSHPAQDPDRILAPEDLVMLSGKQAKRIIRAREIRFVEAQGNYTLFYLEGDQTVLMTELMNHWERVLPKDLFHRVHRSLLLNLIHINGIQKMNRDEYQIFMKDLTRPISISRLAMQRLRMRIPEFGSPLYSESDLL